MPLKYDITTSLIMHTCMYIACQLKKKCYVIFFGIKNITFLVNLMKITSTGHGWMRKGKCLTTLK